MLVIAYNREWIGKTTSNQVGEERGLLLFVIIITQCQ
jgi:hypothetical protein